MGAVDMTRGKKPHKVPYKAGDTVVCTHAASSGYSVSKVYEVYANDKGWKCMKDNNGIEDICCMMFSTFRVATKIDITRSKFFFVGGSKGLSERTL